MPEHATYSVGRQREGDGGAVRAPSAASLAAVSPRVIFILGGPRSVNDVPSVLLEEASGSDANDCLASTSFDGVQHREGFFKGCGGSKIGAKAAVADPVAERVDQFVGEGARPALDAVGSRCHG